MSALQNEKLSLRQFVKCKARYHLTTLEDVDYLNKNGTWPSDYKPIDWEVELSKGNLVSLTDFLHKQVTHEKAKTIAILADRMSVPILKAMRGGFIVNLYPRYWLKEMFNTER